jgi:hypothetical protein
MEKDFDKEIDAILRGAAKGLNIAESPKNHLDADEISLFAEGLLPMNARSAAIEHFADCNNCRSILVDVVSFREEVAELPSRNLVEVKSGFAASIRKLFAFPQLGFAMGALTLLFLGLLGYVAIQNGKQSEDMAKAEAPSTKQLPTIANKPVSAAANAPVAAANTAANSATNSAASAANSVQSPIESNSISRIPKAVNVEPKGPNIRTETDSAEKKIDDKGSANELSKKSATSEPMKPVVSEIVPKPSAESKVDDNTYADEERTRSAPAQPKAKPSASAGITSDSTASKASRNVGGKSFKNTNGTWIDSSYRGGKTIKVNRGTKSFDELESGLKQIANSFSEPVIVQWKAKNYRIQ